MIRGRATLMMSACLALVGSSGCTRPSDGLHLGPSQSVADMPLRDDIVQVKKFYPSSPWLSFDEEGNPDPEGFKVNVFLLSAASGKGTFGDGDIVVTLYSLPQLGTQDPAQGEPKLEKRWVLTPEDCLPWRARRETIMGFGYGLRLNWGDVDILGKSVSIQIDFLRNDGKQIRSQPQTFRVPARRSTY